ncbi:MAG: hypothetical protein H6Q06_1615, partial [Acidobacteria bacterium]|nr:hypothetical protein [Acidobacteriota bacterium]
MEAACTAGRTSMACGRSVNETSLMSCRVPDI